MSNKRWTAEMPIYATRPSGGGEVGSIYMALWLMLLLYLLVIANVLVWSVVGLITAVKVVF